jgi:F0F1-type ATP synthase alpha subunit
LDDLTTHAKFYREIALLSKKFPGRSSYPGDIFYTHSKLLERAGNFRVENGKASITCLVGVETIEGDISGYIQTNLMSITDGHIYFDKDLFANGRRPAINYFLSVTRVGRQTQNQLRWGINRELNSFLSLLEKTQSFVHFGAELNEGIKSILNTGEKVISFFDQPMDKIVPLRLQMMLFSIIWLGYFKNETNDRIKFATQMSLEKYHSDKEFKDQVDDLMTKSADFNELLKNISLSQFDINKFLGV